MALQLKNVDDTSKVAEPFLNRFCSYIRKKEILVFAVVLFLYSYEPGDGFLVEYLLIQRSNIKPTTFALADIVSFIMVMAASAVFSRFLRRSQRLQNCHDNQYHCIYLVRVPKCT